MFYPDVPWSQNFQAINVDELMLGPRLIKKDFTNKLTHAGKSSSDSDINLVKIIALNLGHYMF